MPSDSNPPSSPNDEIEILEDDLLAEADLAQDALDDGGFEDEATQVFDPDAHDDAPFEAESTQIYRPDEEGALDDDSASEFVEEATQVWQSPVPEPAPAPSPVRPQRAMTSGAPFAASNMSAPDVDTESTVVTASPLRPSRPVVRQMASAPAPAIPPNRTLWPWAIVAMVAAALVVFVLRADRPKPVETATLALFSSPTNAAVILDGIPLEQRTPLSIPDLEVGNAYRIELRLDGYQSVEETVTAGQAGLLTREIELPAVLGAIVVRTFPEGANVSLDGAERGTSPVTIEALDRSRSYTVAAAAEGYETAERAVAWGENTPTEQVVVLTLSPVVPPVDEETIAEVDALDAAPAPEEPAATPRPTSTSRAATAPRSSGRTEEQAARARHLPAAPARSAVAEPAPQSAPQTAPVASPTRPSERPSVRASEPPTPPALGQLSVQAIPYGQVYVNDRMVDPETPMIGYEIEAGVHAVKVYFVEPGTWSETQSVRIEPGANRVVTFRAPTR